MRRYITRWRGGHRDPAVEAEAQRDLRLAEVEALRAENAHLRVLASRAQLGEWMWRGIAARARAEALERTRELPRSSVRDVAAPTEYFPRRRW